jgi:hypothetical protein
MGFQTISMPTAQLRERPATPVVPLSLVHRALPPVAPPPAVEGAPEPKDSPFGAHVRLYRTMPDCWARIEALVADRRSRRGGSAEPFDRSQWLVPVSYLARIVAEVSDIPVEDITSRNVKTGPCKARHIVAWLAIKYTQFSLPAIASALGRDDHTTCINARDRVGMVVSQLGAPSVLTPRAWAFHLWNAQWPVWERLAMEADIRRQWSAGFDTATISGAIHLPEHEVARVVSREMDRRHAARAAKVRRRRIKQVKSSA